MNYLKKHSGELLVGIGMLMLIAIQLGGPALSNLLSKNGLLMALPTIKNVILIVALLFILIGVVLYVWLKRRESKY